MKKLTIFTIIITALSIALQAQDFEITQVKVQQDHELQQLVFTMEVAGNAGATVPTPNGALDGAPVLGYVFPTNLPPTAVGFDATAGIVALALTSHPDFDDTPLWDENMDAIYDNDGVIWHPHWVILEENTAVPAGLAVKATSSTSILPPTNPGMPMYMDSPGYPVIWEGHQITCTVPLYRMQGITDFKYDGVSALMYVNTSDPDKPMLGVYEVYSIASGDLSLPYDVGNYSADTLVIDISTTGTGLINPAFIKLYPNPAASDIQLELSDNFTIDHYSIKIFRSNGQLAYSQILNEFGITVPIQQIGSTGAYVVQIIENDTGQLVGTKQLILQ